MNISTKIMIFNTIPHKKNLIILSSVLLILGSGAIVILNRINRSLLIKDESLNQEVNVNLIMAVLEKPFYIELIANPSTGFQWQADFDTEILKLNGVDFEQKVVSGQVGQEMIQTFEFQPLTKTQTKITFRYVRPWDGETPPSNTKTYEINIK